MSNDQEPLPGNNGICLFVYKEHDEIINESNLRGC